MVEPLVHSTNFGANDSRPLGCADIVYAEWLPDLIDWLVGAALWRQARLSSVVALSRSSLDPEA